MNDSGGVPVRSFKPYPDYKDSGVEWIGTLPAHWGTKRLRYVAPVAEVRSHRDPGDLPYVALEHIESHLGRLVAPAESAGEVVPSDSGTTLFAPGDVLFGKLRPYLAKVIRPEFAGHCSTELLVLRARDEVTPSMLAYELLSDGFIKWVDALTYGTKMPRANPAQITNMRIALPPDHEQQAITAFLDRETAKIDALIAKKERLIELLQEKRTALISHAVTRAVTRAVDQSVRLVATASAVFPEIPELWELRKLRRIIRRVTRPVTVDLDADYREIGIRSWGKGIFHKDPVRGALLEGKSVFRIEPGDFVLNIVFAWEGAVGVAAPGEQGMVASHRFPTFHCASDVDADYFLMLLQTEQGRAVMEVNSPGAAGRNRTIRIQQFLDEEIPLPPLPEQRAIAALFRTEEKRAAVLAANVRDAIARLEEYRSALISAAVTGKIDVRGEAA